MSDQDDLFHPVIELPEPVRQARYRRLVGLDEIKDRLRKEAMLLADPGLLERWARTHHGEDVGALTLFIDRAPCSSSPATSDPVRRRWRSPSAATSPTHSLCRSSCTGSSSPPAAADSSAR